MGKNVLLQSPQIEPSTTKYLTRNGKYIYRDGGNVKVFKTIVK
jgi:hypothetical protein